MAKAGMNPKTLQYLMEHSDISGVEALLCLEGNAYRRADNQLRGLNDGTSNISFRFFNIKALGVHIANSVCVAIHTAFRDYFDSFDLQSSGFSQHLSFSLLFSWLRFPRLWCQKQRN